MPLKLKPGELVTCDICGCSISAKDRVNHQSVCTEDNPLLNDLHKLNHPLIFEYSLLAKCHLLTSKEIQEQVHFKPVGKIVLLHPATMMHGQFYFGKPIMLNRSTVFTAWTSTAVPINTIGLEKETLECLLPLKGTDYILVEAFIRPCVDASILSCTLRADDGTLVKNNDFCSYIAKLCVNRYVTTGNSLKIDYYGKECELKIVKITGVDGSETSDLLSSQDCDTDGLETELKNQCTISESPPLASTLVKSKTNNDRTGYFTGLPSQSTFYCASHTTKVKFFSDTDDDFENINEGSSLDDFGGYCLEVEKLKEMIKNHLYNSRTWKNQGIHCPQSALLYGPSGSGKSMLAKAIGKHFPVHFMTITGADVWSKFYGETESKINKLFEEAKERAPSIIFLDDVDILCPKREKSKNQVERRVVSTLLTLLDELSSSREDVFILAATNKRLELEVSIRRPGRLETEIEIGVPSVEDRCMILECILKKTHHNISPESIHEIGEKAHGFLGSDLSAVCKEATLQSLRKCQESGKVNELPPITVEHLLRGFQLIKPSAMKEVQLEVAKVSWDDIGGQEELKHKLRQAVEWPLKHPEAFTRMGIRPPRGLLMYGPPGCSKTMIAKALARESGLNFIAIKGPELFSKWVGESERAVRDVFSRARAAAPAIVFFDEIDALASSRGSGGGGGDVSDRVLAQLLTEMDGVQGLEDVMVVAATNRPDRIDKALMRPGRLDRIVYVSLPDKDTRHAIYMIKFRKTPTAPDVDVNELVEMTENYSGAEVAAVCHEAALAAMQEDINAKSVYRKHFLQALSTITPRITPELMEIYEKYVYQTQNSGR